MTNDRDVSVALEVADDALRDKYGPDYADEIRRTIRSELEEVREERDRWEDEADHNLSIINDLRERLKERGDLLDQNIECITDVAMQRDRFRRQRDEWHQKAVNWKSEAWMLRDERDELREAVREAKQRLERIGQDIRSDEFYGKWDLDDLRDRLSDALDGSEGEKEPRKSNDRYPNTVLTALECVEFAADFLEEEGYLPMAMQTRDAWRVLADDQPGEDGVGEIKSSPANMRSSVEWLRAEACAEGRGKDNPLTLNRKAELKAAATRLERAADLIERLTDRPEDPDEEDEDE